MIACNICLSLSDFTKHSRTLKVPSCWFQKTNWQPFQWLSGPPPKGSQRVRHDRATGHACSESEVKVAQSCPTLWDPMDYIYSPWNSPGQDTGVGSLSLLQGIFLTQGLNPGLPPCRGILYQLSHKGGLHARSIPLDLYATASLSTRLLMGTLVASLFWLL